MNFDIDPMTAKDWPAVETIYREGIATGIATFETEVPDRDTWERNHLTSCRLVARDADGCVLAFAVLLPVSSRKVYAGVAEVSIYVSESARGKGVGKALLLRLVDESERAGFWTLQAGIFQQNAASIRLHERCGFRKVGVRERIGCLNGQWHDVVLLERRQTQAAELSLPQE